LEKAEISDLGHAKRVQISKEDTTVVDGAGETDKIVARVKQMRTQIEELTSD